MGRPRCARKRGRSGSTLVFPKAAIPMSGGILEHITDGRTIPDGLAGSRPLFGCRQPTADLTNGTPIVPDPAC
jgi:hypothetical protein